MTTIYKVTPQPVSVAAGTDLNLTFKWDATVMPLPNKRVLVHFLHPTTWAIAFQGTHDLPSPYLTSTWTGTVEYEQTIPIAQSIPVGTYNIYAGLYDPGTSNPRPALGMGPGVTNDGSNRYFVGQAQVTVYVPPPPQTTEEKVAALEVAVAPLVEKNTLENAYQSQYVPPGYVPVFMDNFVGTKLDQTKWFTRYLFNNGTLDYFPDEQHHQRFRETNPIGKPTIVVANGELTLNAYPAVAPETFWRSAMVRAKTEIGPYFYAEALIKVPSGKGVAPGWWFSTVQQDKWTIEIDQMEYVNTGDFSETPNTMHLGGVFGPNRPSVYLETDPAYHTDFHWWTAPYNFRDDYHLFRVLREEPDTVTCWIDNKMICKFKYPWLSDDGTPGTFVSMMLCHVIGSNFGTNDQTIVPDQVQQIMKCKYMAIYQRHDLVKTQQSTVGTDFTITQ